MQIALSQAQAEAADKDAKIAKLEASFKEKQELVEYRGYQYRKGADGKTARATVLPAVSGKGHSYDDGTDCEAWAPRAMSRV